MLAILDFGYAKGYNSERGRGVRAVYGDGLEICNKPCFLLFLKLFYSFVAISILASNNSFFHLYSKSLVPI